jgi:hypothetical protein
LTAAGRLAKTIPTAERTCWSGSFRVAFSLLRPDYHHRRLVVSALDRRNENLLYSLQPRRVDVNAAHPSRRRHRRLHRTVQPPVNVRHPATEHRADFRLRLALHPKIANLPPALGVAVKSAQIIHGRVHEIRWRWSAHFERSIWQTSLANRRDVTMVCAAASAEHGKLGHLVAQSSVLAAELHWIAGVERCRRVEFRVAK